jgi:hypothetical protein
MMLHLLGDVLQSGTECLEELDSRYIFLCAGFLFAKAENMCAVLQSAPQLTYLGAPTNGRGARQTRAAAAAAAAFCAAGTF